MGVGCLLLLVFAFAPSPPATTIQITSTASALVSRHHAQGHLPSSHLVLRRRSVSCPDPSPLRDPLAALPLLPPSCSPNADLSLPPSSFQTAPETATQQAVLKTYFCLCGEFLVRPHRCSSYSTSSLASSPSLSPLWYQTSSSSTKTSRSSLVDRPTAQLLSERSLLSRTRVRLQGCSSSTALMGGRCSSPGASLSLPVTHHQHQTDPLPSFVRCAISFGVVGTTKSSNLDTFTSARDAQLPSPTNPHPLPHRPRGCSTFSTAGSQSHRGACRMKRGRGRRLSLCSKTHLTRGRGFERSVRFSRVEYRFFMLFYSFSLLRFPGEWLQEKRRCTWYFVFYTISVNRGKHAREYGVVVAGPRDSVGVGAKGDRRTATEVGSEEKGVERGWACRRSPYMYR